MSAPGVGVSAPGGCLPGGCVSAPGGVCLLWGVSAWGVSAPGVGVSAPGGGVCLGGCVSAPGGGVSALGCVCLGGVCSGGSASVHSACWDTTPPPVNRITHACENITLPQLRCRQ